MADSKEREAVRQMARSMAIIEMWELLGKLRESDDIGLGDYDDAGECLDTHKATYNDALVELAEDE